MGVLAGELLDMVDVDSDPITRRLSASDVMDRLGGFTSEMKYTRQIFGIDYGSGPDATYIQEVVRTGAWREVMTMASRFELDYLSLEARMKVFREVFNCQFIMPLLDRAFRNLSRQRLPLRRLILNKLHNRKRSQWPRVERDLRFPLRFRLSRERCGPSHRPIVVRRIKAVRTRGRRKAKPFIYWRGP